VDQEKFYIVVTIAAAIIAISFIAQAATFMFIYRAIKRLTGIAASLQAKAEPLIDQAQGTVVTVKTSVEKITAQAKETFEKVTIETRAVAAAVSASSQEISRLARHQAEQFSESHVERGEAGQRLHCGSEVVEIWNSSLLGTRLPPERPALAAK